MSPLPPAISTCSPSLAHLLCAPPYPLNIVAFFLCYSIRIHVNSGGLKTQSSQHHWRKDELTIATDNCSWLDPRRGKLTQPLSSPSTLAKSMSWEVCLTIATAISSHPNNAKLRSTAVEGTRSPS
jgi:hypothetical protein